MVHDHMVHDVVDVHHGGVVARRAAGREQRYGRGQGRQGGQASSHEDSLGLQDIPPQGIPWGLLGIGLGL